LYYLIQLNYIRDIKYTKNRYCRLEQAGGVRALSRAADSFLSIFIYFFLFNKDVATKIYRCYDKFIVELRQIYGVTTTNLYYSDTYCKYVLIGI